MAVVVTYDASYPLCWIVRRNGVGIGCFRHLIDCVLWISENGYSAWWPIGLLY